MNAVQRKIRRLTWGAMVLSSASLLCFAVAFLPWLFQPWPNVARAAPPGYPRQWVVDGSLRPMGYHRYTDLSTSVDLTDRGTFTIPAGAHLVLLHVEDANVRWRDFPRTLGDTTDPTATVGMPIFAGDGLYPYDGRLDWIEFIEMSQGAVLHASFYGM